MPKISGDRQIKPASVGTSSLQDGAATTAKLNVNADLDARSNKITNLGAPSLATDAATKQYVDTIAEGLDTKESVKAATTANITLSGAQTVDTVSVVADDRVLVKDQSNAVENGIYVAQSGAWARASDMSAGGRSAGAYMFVEMGAVNSDNGYVCDKDTGSDVVGTDSLTFVKFTGGMTVSGSAGFIQYNNGSGGLGSSSGLAFVSDSLSVAVTSNSAGHKAVRVENTSSDAAHSADGLSVSVSHTAGGAAVALRSEVTTSTSNAPFSIVSHKVSSTAAPQANFGGNFEVQVEGAGGLVQSIAAESTLADVSSGGETSALRLRMLESGSGTTPVVLKGSSVGVGIFSGTESPNSTLHLKGSESHEIKSIFGTFAVTDATRTLSCDTSSAAVTVTLQDTTSRGGRIVTICDTAGNAATNNITITPHTGQTINGAVGGASIQVNYGSLVIQVIGSGWIIVGGTI